MEGTCSFAFEDVWTDRGVNYAGAGFLSEPGVLNKK